MSSPGLFGKVAVEMHGAADAEKMRPICCQNSLTTGKSALCPLMRALVNPIYHWHIRSDGFTLLIGFSVKIQKNAGCFTESGISSLPTKGKCIS